MIIYRAYEQLTSFHDNVSGTSKKILSQSGHQIIDVFFYIANCFWKGVIVSFTVGPLGGYIFVFFFKVEGIVF